MNHPILLRSFALLVLVNVVIGLAIAEDPIVVPASTAYAIPAERGIRISPEGVSRWTDAGVRVRWYGHVKEAGEITPTLVIRPKQTGEIRLKFSVDDREQEVTVDGEKGKLVRVEFATGKIEQSGYHSFTLTSIDSPPRCDVESLELTGTATHNAHFNLKPRRNAASVHLAYPIPGGDKVSAFYCEMTGLEDPVWTYYMACGWHRGYFGMQVNSPTERRIIFSVWDSGGEKVDRDKVADPNRVKLVAKGKDVYTGSFGNEGTGGHSHLKFAWKTGEKQRFLVTAEPVDATHTIFAGYYFRPDTKEWMLISSWNAPKEGKRLRGLYSFSENFAGRNGNVVRKAIFGNQWIRTSEGRWIEVTEAKFSHDRTGKSDRLDRFMGIEDRQFFLSHGGFVEGFTERGKPFTRPSSNRSPEKMKLPPLPPVEAS